MSLGQPLRNVAITRDDVYRESDWGKETHKSYPVSNIAIPKHSDSRTSDFIGIHHDIEIRLT